MYSWREQEENGKAEIVADEVAEKAYGDAEHDEVFVFKKGGHKWHKGGWVDECHRGDEGAVAVKMEESREEDLQQ